MSLYPRSDMSSITSNVDIHRLMLWRCDCTTIVSCSGPCDTTYYQFSCKRFAAFFYDHSGCVMGTSTIDFVVLERNDTMMLHEWRDYLESSLTQANDFEHITFGFLNK